MEKLYVYLLTNRTNIVLYVGVTNDLMRRIYEHANQLVLGFSSKYKVTKLVYFQRFADIEDAIAAEKMIKGWLREKKIKLIESVNPAWKDLSGEILR